MKSVVEVSKTVIVCAIFYLGASMVVKNVWPLLSSLRAVQEIPPAVAAWVSFLTSLCLFFVLTHMGRGQIDPSKLLYKLAFGGCCLAFSISTIHPTQFSVGAAALNFGFFLVTLQQIVTRKK